jgi:hypothetical protein
VREHFGALDATYDYEVWNQPMYGYQYSYFNPQRNRPAASLREATVSRQAFTNDRFRRYRSAQTAAVVGIAMRASYIVETAPTHADTDDSTKDRIHSVDYLYDLELDASGRILGGEWRQNVHPDFLWTPPPQARAVTAADQFATGTWSVSQAVPQPWRQAARRGSRFGAPLAKVVERLIQAASA